MFGAKWNSLGWVWKGLEKDKIINKKWQKKTLCRAYFLRIYPRFFYFLPNPRDRIKWGFSGFLAPKMGKMMDKTWKNRKIANKKEEKRTPKVPQSLILCALRGFLEKGRTNSRCLKNGGIWRKKLFCLLFLIWNFTQKCHKALFYALFGVFEIEGS